MNLDKKHEAGQWFLTAAIHYNILNFCDGYLFVYFISQKQLRK
jgi:hypothetical protein